MKRCPRCFGNKKVMGIGMVETDCQKCDGEGKVKDVDPSFFVPVDSFIGGLKESKLEGEEIYQTKNEMNTIPRKQVIKEL
jgi:DnaJ-class molecular chaperone